MMKIISSVIVGIILLALVFLVIRSMVRDKKAGKGICGGDCSACKGCHCKECVYKTKFVCHKQKVMQAF